MYFQFCVNNNKYPYFKPLLYYFFVLYVCITFVGHPLQAFFACIDSTVFSLTASSTRLNETNHRLVFFIRVSFRWYTTVAYVTPDKTSLLQTCPPVFTKAWEELSCGEQQPRSRQAKDPSTLLSLTRCCIPFSESKTAFLFIKKCCPETHIFNYQALASRMMFLYDQIKSCITTA